MECKKCLSLLGVFKDGELSGDAASPVKSHIETCPACSAELEALYALSELITSIKAPPAPDGFEDNVIRAMRKPVRQFSFIPSFRPAFFYRPAMAMAVLALLVVTGVFYARKNTAPDESYAQLLISDAELREFDSDILDIFYGEI
ncbi:zf-HC2 domain-containing protein [bacterium]|nr:hypothetical protein [Candidatus Omnitrophota bacterium]MBU2527783.1 zf-HC2 domain-containing protein [bacterium]MBU3930417.1 zf-HC2 domain-containing protein [bacterium]MBU4123268.1 zf-HC2 domain-containing protein [bacterium]